MSKPAVFAKFNTPPAMCEERSISNLTYAAWDLVRLAQTRPSRRASKTILIVDEEEGIRTTLQFMLEQLGFQTITAKDGLEAVETYRANPDRIWCVLLDATMPELSGEATLQELMHIRKNVRVVLSSGYSEADVRKRFADLNFSAFLQKPYSRNHLARILQKLGLGRDEPSARLAFQI